MRLIVNADDFGLTAGVDQVVAELANAGALRSTTLMARGADFEGAAALARQTANLHVGCHVTLVDGLPCAEAARIPTLLDHEGKLRSSLLAFLVHLQSGGIPEEEIEREATAQIACLQNAGLVVTHVDTHKHTHLFPRVARPLMRAAAACDVRGIRNPFEQAWSARLTRGALLRRLEVTALRGFQHSFQELLRSSGLRSTDGSIGVSATGSLDAAMLRTLLAGVPPGTWELVCHPGRNDADLAAIPTRLRQTREVEHAALLKQIPAAKASGAVTLLSYADL